MTTDIDYDALWTRAAGEHSAANERLQKEREASTNAALREVVFAAMSHGVHTLTLGSSDQGDFMSIDAATDAEGDVDVDDLYDDLWAVSDLDDHYEADWATTEGITADWLRSGSIVVINVPKCAAALAEIERVTQDALDLAVSEALEASRG